MARASIVIGFTVVAGVATLGGERKAAACGGCFHPPTQTATDITDERMLLSVSTAQTTLYDQIQYSGKPTSFAWVLPIHGTVDVGLSADVLFDSIDALTATQIQAPPYPCAPPPNCFFAPTATGSVAVDAGAALDTVTVLKQDNVGPYATVQLQSTDPAALENWLAANGFMIPADVQPVIAAYLSEGFDFLAMKLLPNQGVQAMRPVRITTAGASLSLPMRMASVGTGAVTGITIWVVADGRYEPQNYPFFYIADSDLVWDWKISLSNYTTLRVQNEANLKGAGWELESSLTLSQQLITSVILSGGRYYGGGFGFGLPAEDAGADYLPIGSPTGDSAAYQTAEEVRTADVATLFKGLTGPNARVTRMRSDIAHSAMTKDFVLQASADQSDVSNVRNVTKSVNYTCQVYPACPGSSGSGGVSTSGSLSGGGVVDASVSSGSITGSPVGSGVTSGSSAGSSVIVVGVNASGSAATTGTTTAGGSSGSASATSGGGALNASGGGGGCAAAPRPSSGLAVGLGAVAALAVAAARGRRRRGPARKG